MGMPLFFLEWTILHNISKKINRTSYDFFGPDTHGALRIAVAGDSPGHDSPPRLLSNGSCRRSDVRFWRYVQSRIFTPRRAIFFG